MERTRTSFTFPVSTLAGSSVSNIRAVCRNHTIERKYYFKFFLSAILAGILGIFSLIEKIRWHKKIKNYIPEKPPVFIIGFWRSGTTLLHNLLCQDPDAAYTTTYHTVFPHLVLTQKWLKYLTNFLLPPNRPYDNVSMDMDFPQEEDFGMMNLQPLTIYKFFLFPKEFDKILNDELHFEDVPDELLQLWKKTYRNMMAKAVFNTGGTRYIGKNPCHLARIKVLKEMFPEAKFIFIHRDPNKVNESLYHFILSIFPGVKLQDVPEDFSREQVVRLYADMMHTYFKDKENLPASDLYELSIDELKDDVEGHIRKIYEQFGMEDFDLMIPRIRKYLEKNSDPLRQPYPPTEETIHLVNKYAGDIVRRLGYRSSSEVPVIDQV